LGGPKVKRPLENLGIGERITLSWTLWRRQGSMGRTGQGPVADFCEHDDEPSVSIEKAGFFFEKLRDNQLLK
jgi:hypothetical protein